MIAALFRRQYARLLIPWVCVALSSCSSLGDKMPFSMPTIADENADQLLFPARPEIPRYAFVGNIYGESNAGERSKSRGTMDKFLDLITGFDDRPENYKNLIQPQYITTDGKGRIFVADAGQQSIFIFDEVLGEFYIWDSNSLNLPLLSPIGLAYGFDSLWITDSELSRVYQIDDQGQFVRSFGEGTLTRPTGISIDLQRSRLMVSDTAADNIKVFNLDGELISIWGHSGSAPGELNHPTYITFFENRLYVADSLNARIQVFDEQGNHLQVVGERGMYVGNLSRPKGIALDSDGNIYIAESYYDHLLIFNAGGNLLMAIGGSGNKPGNFYQPTAVWVDEYDRVFVSDMLNSRVSVFQYLGDSR